LVCEYDGHILGYAYASSHKERPAYQWAVDVSVYVDEAWRRKGVASALYESLFALLDVQGLSNAYAVIALPNDQSVAFHESHGFEPVGVYTDVGYKHGEWRDVGHWEVSTSTPTRSGRANQRSVRNGGRSDARVAENPGITPQSSRRAAPRPRPRGA
jgi:phosphinothricin acetyltransferase